MSEPTRRDPERERFDALAATLGLSKLDLAASATVRPGTLGKTAPPPSPAATLPRIDVARAAGVSGAELELSRVLGEGGMGTVWLARQRSLDREVAIKRVREGTQPTGEVAAALLAEGRATGALEHPSIVPVHALGVDGLGAPLLVMKRVEGASLEDLLRAPDHPAWPALERRHGDRLSAQVEILMRVADALELAHARGFVHRDVKPENVMVGAFGEVYLLDWGVALDRRTPPTDEPSIVGTPAYMAPEMVHGVASAIDARTDVYLLGATLHRVLSGQPRHRGSTIQAVLFEALVSTPMTYGTDVPVELGAIANEATAREPERRYPDAAAFREALAGFLRHRGAERLAKGAAARLARLSDGGEPSAAVLATPAASRTLLECRFALERSLEDWPENQAARAAREETLRWLVLGELERRSPDAAAAFLAELGTPDAALRERIEKLRVALDEGRRLEEEARAEQRERDPRVAVRQRLLVGGGTLVAVPVLLLAASQSGLDTGSLPTRFAFGIDLVLAASASLAFFVLRRSFLENRAARQAAGTFLTALFTLTLVDGVGAVTDATYSETAPFVLLGTAGVLGGSAIGGSTGASRRAAFLSPIPLVLGAALCLLLPAQALFVAGGAYTASLLVFVLDTARHVDRSGGSPPAGGGGT
jgi:serine/threonine-protein kinase